MSASAGADMLKTWFLQPTIRYFMVSDCRYILLIIFH
jgi:hypothetical protein